MFLVCSFIYLVIFHFCFLIFLIIFVDIIIAMNLSGDNKIFRDLLKKRQPSSTKKGKKVVAKLAPQQVEVLEIPH